ncbi:bahd acyltransferase [Homalodisca vitripennis]|nr:bahd acyltransferase [Homalodisca vitripennis]
MKVSDLWKHDTALSVVSHVVGETHGAVLVPKGTTKVFVLVEDQNDNIPLADKPAYSGHVLENCPTHTSVLRVSASDADQGPGERINFNITAGNTAGHFAIDDTGLIYTTTDQIDREEQEEYVLEVKFFLSSLNHLSKITIFLYAFFVICMSMDLIF